MKNYIVSTYHNGKNLTNLLSNRLVQEIEKENKNHKTKIQVVDNQNFIVVRGFTTHKKPINLSQLFVSYYSELFGKEKPFNVIDLINYDTPPQEDFIYLKKDYYSDKLLETLQHKSDEDSFNGKDYRFTANTDMDIVLMEGNIKDNDLTKFFEDYDYYTIKNSINTFTSDPIFGMNLKTTKLFDFYFNYITYNIFERKLCKDLSIEFFTDSPFEEINWENIKLNVKSNSLIVSEEWLTSLILDLFSFEPQHILEKWELSDYNFESEIIKTKTPLWKIKDKVGEMILI